MATHYRQYIMSYQQDEATAAKLIAFFEVGTDEAQTLQVSKAGGAYVTSYSTATKLEGLQYVIAIDDDDIGTIGALAFKSVGPTDTHYIWGMDVVEHDVQDAVRDIRQALCGKVITDTDDDTIKIYDTDGVTVLLTLTKSTAGTVTTWTPS